MAVDEVFVGGADLHQGAFDTQVIRQKRVDEMGTLNTVAISPVKYRNLVAKAMPKVIETRQELRRFTEMLEALDRPDRTLSPEERALEGLLELLIADYEAGIELPEVPPHD